MGLGTGIPAKAVEKIIPLLVKQMKGLSKLIGKLKQSIASIPPGAKCNDPSIKQLKKNHLNNPESLEKRIRYTCLLCFSIGINVSVSTSQITFGVHILDSE